MKIVKKISPPLKSVQYHILDRKINQLKYLYQTEMTLPEIAEQLKVSKTTLQQKIKELSLKRNPRHKKKTIDTKKLEELLELGVSDKKIQEKLHIGRYVLSRYKKELGVYLEDNQKIAKGKKGANNRSYYKKTGERPECPVQSNILEKHKNEVISLLKNGTLRTEIAKKYGVSRSTVFNFMYLYGIKVPVKQKCDDYREFILQEVQNGKTLKSIAEKLNCHPYTISRYIRIKGLKFLHKKTVKKSFLNNQKDLIQHLYQQGLSGDEIAQKLNVSKNSIYACIKRFNFTRPQKWAEYTSTFKGHDKELLQMRQGGMTLKQIGEIFGVKENTVGRRLKKLNQVSSFFVKNPIQKGVCNGY